MRWISFQLSIVVADAIEIEKVSAFARHAQVADPRFVYLRGPRSTRYQVRCSPELAACVVEVLEMFARDPRKDDAIRRACAEAAAMIQTVSS